jgi:hypothetical protein
MTETISKLYLELAHVVPDGTKTFRDIQNEARIEQLEAALELIDNWSQAYPLTMFPEPDFKEASKVLQSFGMSLDAISASNMRHVVEGVGEIARAALKAGGE